MPGQPSEPDRVGWTRRRFRAPRDDGELLSVPSLGECPAVAAANAEVLDGMTIFGEPLGQLRRQARAEVLAGAADLPLGESGSCHEPAALGEHTGPHAESEEYTSPWFVAGHQPSLFHPGVWVKNFAASALARRTNGVGLNLVVDNDTLAVPGILVPAGDRESPNMETVLFDSARTPETWEEALIRDRRVFESFGERVVAAMQPWEIRPLAESFWREVTSAASGTERVAECLTRARAACERAWGFGNVELPISRMCETSTFRRFAVHLLHEMPRFHALHTQVLQEYREQNRVRSRTHPVPDLRADGAWLEAPFWVWRAGEPGRRRVYVSRSARGVSLSDGQATLATLPQDWRECIRILERLSEGGWRFRSRALTTTLFARLFLADLFIHGIGGAKYDEMTDQLISRFYGLVPPAFLTLSGTAHLPLGAHPVTREDERRIAQRLRSLAFQPERHIPEGERQRWRPLIEEHAALVREQAAIRQARELRRRGVPSQGLARKLRFEQIRADLWQAVESLSSGWREKQEALARQLRANAVLKSREYAAILYPEETLRETFAAWVGPGS